MRESVGPVTLRDTAMFCAECNQLKPCINKMTFQTPCALKREQTISTLREWNKFPSHFSVWKYNVIFNPFTTKGQLLNTPQNLNKSL